MTARQDTRARILDVARELFTEQGYEKTSLREIADRLGFTKAALYYHFQSKEQLLFALVEPMDELVEAFFLALERADGVQGWADALGWVISQMGANLDTFRVMQRNRIDLAALGWPEHRDDHQQMHERLQRAVRTKSNSLHDQVRMVCALAAVTGFDDWAPDLLEALDFDMLQAELTATVRDILGLAPVPEAVVPGEAVAAAR